MPQIVVGVDLAGSPKRWSGVCWMDNRYRCGVGRVKADEDILGFVEWVEAGLVSIDAPLSIPRSGGGYRRCDKEALGMGIPLLSLSLKPMRMLAERGVRLAEDLRSRGYKVIEVYPSGSLIALRIPRRNPMLVEGLRRLGVRCLTGTETKDEVDAAVCALTGWLYLQGRCLELGDPSEGILILPKRVLSHRGEL